VLTLPKCRSDPHHHRAPLSNDSRLGLERCHLDLRFHRHSNIDSDRTCSHRQLRPNGYGDDTRRKTCYGHHDWFVFDLLVVRSLFYGKLLTVPQLPGPTLTVTEVATPTTVLSVSTAAVTQTSTVTTTLDDQSVVTSTVYNTVSTEATSTLVSIVTQTLSPTGSTITESFAQTVTVTQAASVATGTSPFLFVGLSVY
jgi:hypothetical protein